MITQKQWESGTNFRQMIRFGLHRAKNPERKARLYRIALVRQVWGEMLWINRVLTELAERQADGEFDDSVLPRSLEYMAEEVLIGIGRWSDETPCEFPHFGIGIYDSDLAKIGYSKPPDADRFEPTDPARCYELVRLAYRVHFGWAGPDDYSVGHGFDSLPLLLDIFGNPFRPIIFSPTWRTDTAVSLAQQMYHSCDFSAMPILADALQDAGCDDTDILNHCRNPKQVHVRGCWVVDLVLNKA